MAPVTEVVARPARTAAQLIPAAVLVEVLDAFVGLDSRQYASLMAALTLVIGTAQVLVEDHIGHALFRTVPPAKEGRHAA